MAEVVFLFELFILALMLITAMDEDEFRKHTLRFLFLDIAFLGVPTIYLIWTIFINKGINKYFIFPLIIALCVAAFRFGDLIFN